ncbi:4a-hydroxytetrahydrobiopterin dehydratase [soil metagenome]
MATLLDDATLMQELAGLDGWVVLTAADRPVLSKDFTFSDFPAAMDFVNRVAVIAEDEFHHPDITISYNTVGLQITSHEDGGITDKCVTVASRIDKLGETEDT